MSSDADLHLPFSVFTNPETAPLSLTPDVLISIPYKTLYSFLEDAERIHQNVKGLNRRGHVEKLLPGTRLKKRQRTPEEQLEDDDEARFAASEDKAERKVYREDGAWEHKKTRKLKDRGSCT